MLRVRIYSFSYKKSGIPGDDTTNGGGFVFDCRFIFNPGRIKEFTAKTGKDPEVKDFLDKQAEMQNFLSNVYDIINPAIENYSGRDFTNLMISFGCTGGQHRSVYSAENLYHYLCEAYKDKISLEVKHMEFPELSD